MARNKAFDEKEVLGKAVKLFGCKGYNATSAQEMVDALGISRSSLYDTWGDKRTLFLKALESYRNENNVKFVAFLDQVEDPKAALEQIVHNTVANIIGDTQCNGCLMLNSSIELAAHDADVNKIVVQNQKFLEDGFARLIQKGQDMGQFHKKSSAQAMSRYLYSSIIGMQSIGKTDSEKSGLHDVAALTLASFY